MRDMLRPAATLCLAALAATTCASCSLVGSALKLPGAAIKAAGKILDAASGSAARASPMRMVEAIPLGTAESDPHVRIAARPTENAEPDS